MTTDPVPDQPSGLSLYYRLLQVVLMRLRPAPIATALKRILRVRRVTVTTLQGRFCVDPVSIMGIALTRGGTYESGMIATLNASLTHGSTFVDLGANEGYFTVIGAGLCGPTGRVVAIEPQERLLPIISKNLHLNSLLNTIVVNAAITDRPGQVTLHLTSNTNSGGSGLHRHTKYPLPTQEVAAMTLEQLLDVQGVKVVDLLKVDIEGSEYEALLGSPRLFQECRIKALALELHPTILADRGKDAEDIVALLTGAGYQKKQPFGNDLWLAPRC